MSESFMYNQEVTAQMLNNIAIDLGNTSFCGFGKEKFGAEELNKITQSLVGKGVLLSGQMCRPVYANGMVNIQSGTIVFENGAKKNIEEAVNIAVQEGEYVYAQNDVYAGTCQIVAAKELPKSGDYVVLARLKEDGTLKDMREISKAKEELNCGNAFFEYTLSPQGKTWAELARIPLKEWDYIKFVLADDGRDDLTHRNFFYKNDIEFEKEYKLHPSSNYRPVIKFQKEEDEVVVKGYREAGNAAFLLILI